MKEIQVKSAEIARLCGITDRHVRRLSSEGKLPAITGDKMPLAESLSMFISYLRVQGTTRLSEAKLRKAEIDAEMRQLDYDERRGKLVDSRNFELFTCAVWIPIRNDLFNIGEAVAAEVANAAGNPSKVRDILQRELSRVLGDFQNRITREEYLARFLPEQTADPEQLV